MAYKLTAGSRPPTSCRAVMCLRGSMYHDCISRLAPGHQVTLSYSGMRRDDASAEKSEEGKGFRDASAKHIL
jgi:hypothetical protein